MTTQVKDFKVTGMTCSSCEGAVRDELELLEGVNEISISAKTGDLSVTLAEGANVSEEAIIEAIDEAGYEAVAK